MNFKDFLKSNLDESFLNDKIAFSSSVLVSFNKYNEIPNTNYMISLYYAYIAFNKSDLKEFEKYIKDIVSETTIANGYGCY